MGDGFVLLDLTLLGGQCPSVGPGRTHDAATRTRLLVWDFVGLLLQEQFERPFGQTLSSHSGDLLKRAEVHIEPRSGIPEGSLGDDFGPSTSEGVEFLEFLVAEAGRRHGCPALELRRRGVGISYPKPSGPPRTQQTAK